jgi:hypothetical protein
LRILWTFRYYRGPKGDSDVRLAYDRGSKELKGKFLSRLRILGQLPPDQWNETYFKQLTGPCDGLSEIRFEADGVQQRPLGYRSGSLEYTMLFWAEERDGKWAPRTACTVALRRKREAVTIRNVTDFLWIALE